MDPTKNSLLQRILTVVFGAILAVAYRILRITLKNKADAAKQMVDPPHLMHPSGAIPAMPLAQALNPKTPVSKLLFYVNHEDPFVRRAIVRNPSLPVEEIKRLAVADPVDMVREEAARVLKSRNEFDSRGYELSAMN